jgi:hypothetical protein
VVLWLRGQADLRYACLRSVSVVGSRAATAYGSHVCAELAAALAERGFTVLSGPEMTKPTTTQRVYGRGSRCPTCRPVSPFGPWILEPGFVQPELVQVQTSPLSSSISVLPLLQVPDGAVALVTTLVPSVPLAPGGPLQA